MINLMSHYRRADLPGATYFFTVVTYRRRPILCDVPVRTALRTAIKTVQSRHPFTIDAWVLLPDHLHCIWTLPFGDANYPMRWGHIKRLVSQTCTELYHRPEWLTVFIRRTGLAPPNRLICLVVNRETNRMGNTFLPAFLTTTYG